MQYDNVLSNRISPSKEIFDNAILDLKVELKEVPTEIVVPDSIYPEEYRGHKKLKFDDKEIKIIVVKGI